ncbi:MAG: hypothetical protein IKO65_06890 [Victivallales bacterium]|nr:hypothetical protein [Victivallales bacterium]
MSKPKKEHLETPFMVAVKKEMKNRERRLHTHGPKLPPPKTKIKTDLPSVCEFVKKRFLANLKKEKDSTKRMRKWLLFFGSASWEKCPYGTDEMKRDYASLPAEKNKAREWLERQGSGKWAKCPYSTSEFCISVAESSSEQEKAKKWLYENVERKLEECPFCTNYMCSLFIYMPEFRDLYTTNSYRWLKANGFDKWKQCPIDASTWLKPLIFSSVSSHICEITHCQEDNITPEHDLDDLLDEWEYFYFEQDIGMKFSIQSNSPECSNVNPLGCNLFYGTTCKQVKDCVNLIFLQLQKLQVSDSTQIINKLFLDYSNLAKLGDIRCDACGGKKVKTCYACQGMGRTGILWWAKTCSVCNGSGKIVCSKCNGKGKIKGLRLP